MLDKSGTFKQTRMNSDGQCETRTNQNFEKDYNADSLVVQSYNTFKMHHHQLLHCLQYQQLQDRFDSPLYQRIYSHCCGDEQSSHAAPLFNIGKTELRSIEKRGFLSPSHKECKEESEDGEKRLGYHYYGDKGRRLLEYFGLHPNANITSLKRPQEDFKQTVRYDPSNNQEQQKYNGEAKMDNVEDVDIKVDDCDDVDVEAEEKFNNCNNSRSSSINGRISCNSSSSSSGGDSVCSGDEDDVDNSIDGGRHKHDDDNSNNNNNISLKTTDLKISDINSTKIYTDTERVKNFASQKNNRFKNHDTDYQPHINNGHYENTMRDTLTGEYGRRFIDQARDHAKKLSGSYTHENTHSPPDLTRNFTNFLIDDILKPGFGKRPFETGTTTIRTVTPVVRRGFNKSFPSSSSSFPFSISSLSQSSLLSPPSSPSSINSQNYSVPSPGKKKSFSRYGSGSDSRCLPSKSSPSLSSISVAALDSSRSLQTGSEKQQTLSPNKTKKDLTSETPVDPKSGENLTDATGFQFKYPAWVFCTRYSDRPSSGPRSRKMKRKDKKPDEKRPRTAFTPEQLQRLKREFDHGRYLTEERRQSLAKELGLNESQIKIWFQNKRAKMKKVSGTKNPLALQLIAEGLYNHQTNKE